MKTMSLNPAQSNSCYISSPQAQVLQQIALTISRIKQQKKKKTILPITKY